MLNFDRIPVIDHHCHLHVPDCAILEPEQLAQLFYHGMGDLPKDGVIKEKRWGKSEELRSNFPHMGVVKTLLCRLSKLLDCPADLEAVARERNRRTSDDFPAYARLLYDDAGIVGTVLDAGVSADDPRLELIPGNVLRLFQFDATIDELVPKSDTYQNLLDTFQRRLATAVNEQGFIGVKGHLAERVGFGTAPVWEDEATSVFPKAKAGDLGAFKKIYTAVFVATLLQCQKLDVPVHLHTGCTGSMWQGPLHDGDPFLLAPFLRHKAFFKSKIVLLHAGYPWTKQAGQLTHMFPHVWVDTSQMSPWASLRIVECYRDVMAWAPLSKVMIGSGGHGSPEIAYLAAKTAKIALSEVLGDAVRLELMTQEHAEEAARMVLHDNAARLYGLAGDDN